MLLGGGSFKTLPTCLSGVEGMHSWVTSLIDIPSSQGGDWREGEEEEEEVVEVKEENFHC